MNAKYDILIVGAGPAGIYLGWQLAKKGRTVLILERDSRETVGSKMDQFHMDTIAFEEFEVPPPDPGTEEFITTIESTNHYSPAGKNPKKMKWGNIAMRFQFFILRLIKLAEQDGVQFQFSSQFKKGIYRDNKLVGIIVDRDNKEHEFLGRIFIDASGTSAVVRTSLPDDYGVETFKIEDDEKMYVIQRVIRWLKPNEPHPGKEVKSNTWMYYKTWVAPHFLPDVNLFGNGQPGGYENTEKALEIFLNNIPFPPYEIIEVHRATTTYHRSPFSLVGNGFLCIGDSACMTKPFNGEGISLTWIVCKNASEVIDKALQQLDYVNKEKLWGINVQYFRNEGAKIAALLAQIPGAANAKKKEMEYLFKKNIIFSSKDFEDMNNYLELQIGLGRMLRIAFLLLWGLLTHRFSRSTLGSMLSSMKISGKIRKHYENFPEDPKNFDDWVQKAESMWSQIEKMKFTLMS